MNKRSLNSPFRRRLRLEALEERRLLAADGLSTQLLPVDDLTDVAEEQAAYLVQAAGEEANQTASLGTGSVVVGENAPNTNYIPFGSNYGSRYQQVYSAAEFPEAVSINAVKFFSVSFDGYSGVLASGVFNFEFSVTTQAVDGLDTVELENNVTGDVLGTGTLVLDGGDGHDLIIDVTPFIYDPAQGNLLMDIKFPGGLTRGPGYPAPFEAYNGEEGTPAGGIFSRAYDGDGYGFEGWGLKTEFLLSDSAEMTAGSLDASFADDGAIIESHNGKNENGQAVAVYDDPASPDFGKVISISTGNRPLIRRYHSDGSTDTSFSGDGLIRIGDNPNIADVIIQPNGKLVTGGGGNTGEFNLIRYKSGGGRDNSFGGDGVAETTLSGVAPVGIEQLPNGALLAVAEDFSDIHIASLTSDGQLDVSFGNAGIASVSETLFGTTAVIGFRVDEIVAAPSFDGGFYVAGTFWDAPLENDNTDNDLFVLKFAANGELDESFDGDGVLTIERDRTIVDPTLAMTVRSNGKVLLAYDQIVGTYQHPDGFEADDQRLVLAQFLPDGSPDLDFGDAGVATGPFRSDVFQYQAHSIAVAPDGKVVVGGIVGFFSLESGITTQLFVSRHLADGSLDPGFGDAGFSLPELDGCELQRPARDLAVSPEGDVFVSTSTWETTQSWQSPNSALLKLEGGELLPPQPGVVAEIINGTLMITGGDDKDEIRLTSSGIPALEDVSILIEGLDGTQINGADSASFNGVTEIRVATGKGADSVVLANRAVVPTYIETGRGRDYVELNGNGGFGAEGDLDVDTGGGNDHVVIKSEGSIYGRPVAIDTGKGNDRVGFSEGVIGTFSEGGIELGKGDDTLVSPTDTSSPIPLDFFGGFVIDGGAGNDREFRPADPAFPSLIGFEEVINCPESGCFVGGDVTTEVVFDPLIGNILVIKGNDHFDHELQLSSTDVGQVTVESFGYAATINGTAAPASFDDIARVKIVLGSGTDKVNTDGLMLDDKLIVKTGLGDDNVQIVGSELKKLKIDTGGGDDTVLLDSTTVNRRAQILTGWGKDDLIIRDSIFRRKVIAEGGLDDDTLSLLGPNLFTNGLYEDFEDVIEY